MPCQADAIADHIFGTLIPSLDAQSLVDYLDFLTERWAATVRRNLRHALAARGGVHHRSSRSLEPRDPPSHRLYSRLDSRYEVVVRQVEVSLLRTLLVAATKAGHHEKVGCRMRRTVQCRMV